MYDIVHPCSGWPGKEYVCPGGDGVGLGEIELGQGDYATAFFQIACGEAVMEKKKVA